MQRLADRATVIPAMLPVDLNQSIELYFLFVQETVEHSERRQIGQDRAAARAAYEGLTKAETGRSARRPMPRKSGNVDEPIERLVDADAG